MNAYKEVTSQGERQSLIGRLFLVGPVMARVVLFGDSKWGVDTSVLQTVDHLYTLNKFVISAFHQIYKITTVHIFKWGNCYSGQSGMEF